MKPILFAICAIGLGLSAATANAATPGVTSNSIVLGQSAAFSGPATRLGESMRDGANLYFNEVNRAGGVHGRKIRLLSLDDGYEPDRAIANTKQLIDNDAVFALFGYVGTPTSYAVIPIVTEAKIPFFGAFTGAEGLRNPMNKYILNLRAGYNQETETLVDFLMNQRKKRIAVFYQNDAYGKAGLSGVQLAMDKRKLPIVALGTVERNTVDVEEAVSAIAKSNPDAIIMVSAYKSCAAFIKEMNKTSARPEYLNVSFVGSDALAAELGAEGHGVYISQVVPYPWDPSSSVSMEFTTLAKQHAPTMKPSFNNLEGYIAAKAFVEGLRRAGPDLTREKFVQTLEAFRDVDLGNFRVSFTPTDHNGSSYVGITIIIGAKGGFMPVFKQAAR